MFKAVFKFFFPFFTFLVVHIGFSQNRIQRDTVTKIRIRQDLIRRDSLTRKGTIRHVVGFPAVLHSPELSWAFGGAGSYYFKFSHKDSAIRTSFVQAIGIATLRKQLVFAFDGTIFFPNEAYILRLNGSLSRFPDRFWGLGNNSLASNREAYTISQYYFFPQLLRQVYKKFYVGAAYESQNVFSFNYGDGRPEGQSIFDLQNIPGRKGSFTSGLGLLFLWDNRNNAFSSSKGFYFQYYINEFNQVLGSNYHYLSQLMDVRKYFKTSKDGVLAIQFVGNFNRGDVPVRAMANIGSATIMRGYYDGRYTDRNLMAIQAEYRQHIYKRVGVVGFAGIGRVASYFSEFNFTGLKPSLGSGLRFSIDRKEKLNARLDFGFGTHSSGIYLNLTEAF